MTAKGHGIRRSVMGCVAIPLLIIIAAVLIENPFRIKPGKGHREAEAQQNLHAIQLALERYAVDYGGVYPLWLSGGGIADPAAGEIDPHFAMDPLMAEGYMPQYPRNPFNRLGTGDTNDNLRAMQVRLSDPLRPGSGSSMEPPVYRFGRDYTLMGNVLADPRFAEVIVGTDSNGNAVRKRTGSDVIYRCWDIEELDEPQYWLQGQFFYKVPSGRTSFVNDISQFSFKTDVSGDYILGTYGSYRNKGKDILGDELPWQVIHNGNATARLLWSFNGIEMPGKSYRQGSPYNWPVAGDYSGFPICYGNPNGQRDGLILVLTAENPADMQFDYPDPQDINQKSEYSWD
ncbi:MAG: type II secretion system protein [Planctomycetales bacterium]|nr:type II secretion system protein [bacterium]UNM08338.1 MAG: type II secretion system protein [Planctomycetales bacterium]